jgi:hypothetical protein
MNRAWAPQTIERATGIAAAETTKALADRTSIGPELAERVATAYDQLWDQPPPQATRQDKELAAAARARAARCGWPPPMAYDDDLIDLPDGHAEPGWKPSGRTSRRSADLAEDTAWVREHGGYQHTTAAAVAMRLGVSRTALEQAHTRTRQASRQAEAS